MSISFPKYGSAYVTFKASNRPIKWIVRFVNFQIERLLRNLTQNKVPVEVVNNYYNKGWATCQNGSGNKAVKGLFGNEIHKREKKSYARVVCVCVKFKEGMQYNN